MKKEKENWEREVYLNGEVVRQLLERFKDNKAIGLVDIKVKAFIPESVFKSEKEKYIEALI